MDVAALQLVARFTLPPNQLGFCGKGSAPPIFRQCIVQGKCTKVASQISHFIVLHPYLKTLSKITGLNKLSYPVVEGYWLGNDLLKKAMPKDYDLLLTNLSSQGVPPWLVDELKHKRPKVFIPFHLFQILHVGVGRASGAVPFNLDSINNCMIRWGKVTSLNWKNSKLTVKLNSLKRESKKFSITQSSQTFDYDPAFLPGLKKGKTVAVHWSWVSKVLTVKEENNLSYWTDQVLASALPV